MFSGSPFHNKFLYLTILTLTSLVEQHCLHSSIKNSLSLSLLPENHTSFLLGSSLLFTVTISLLLEQNFILIQE